MGLGANFGGGGGGGGRWWVELVTEMLQTSHLQDCKLAKLS